MERQPERIFILHITDLHFGDQLPAENGINSFYERLKKFKSENQIVTVHVVITGDFIDRYNPSKTLTVKQFANFVDKVKTILDVPPEKIIFCLGNHDKWQDAYHNLIESLRTLNGGETVLYSELLKEKKRGNNKWEYDDRIIESLLEKENHEIFFNPYELTSTIPPMFRETACPLMGIRLVDGIAYLVLNSSWLCDKNNSGNLTLGIKVTNELLAELDKIPSHLKFFTIGLMHHSFGSMDLSNFHQNGDTNPLSTELFSRCGIILNGHEHGEIYPSMADISTYIFRAGSALALRDLKGNNTFSLIEINFLTRRITKQGIYFDVNNNDWKDLEPIRLEFPIVARNFVLNHKIQINQYFNNVRSFVLTQKNHVKYIPATDYLSGDIAKYPSLKVVCDLESLEKAETLTEYMDIHSKVRSKVLLKLAVENDGYTFAEPLELVSTESNSMSVKH